MYLSTRSIDRIPGRPVIRTNNSGCTTTPVQERRDVAVTRKHQQTLETCTSYNFPAKMLQRKHLCEKPTFNYNAMTIVRLLPLLLLLLIKTSCHTDAAATRRRTTPQQGLPQNVTPTPIITSSNNCTEQQADFLRNVLGASFNTRYMSIDPPTDLDIAYETDPTDDPDTNRSQRAAVASPNDRPAFYVDGDEYLAQHGESVDAAEAAWSRGPFGSESSTRRKRSAQRPWTCRSHIRWLDLGDEYYPRFLRSVECAKQSCWYGHFKCRPRSFMVRILRRRTGKCVEMANSEDSYLPTDMRALWTWEERPVNFCCDCAMN